MPEGLGERSYKWNWLELKKKYLTGGIANVSEFCRNESIPEDTMRKYTTGWRDEYTAMHSQILQEAKERIIKESADKVVSEYNRLMSLAKLLQEFGYKKIGIIENGRITGAKETASVKEAINALNNGIKAELELLQMGKNEGKTPVINNIIHNTQVTAEQIQKLQKVYESLDKYGVVKRELNGSK